MLYPDCPLWGSSNDLFTSTLAGPRSSTQWIPWNQVAKGVSVLHHQQRPALVPVMHHQISCRQLHETSTHSRPSRIAPDARERRHVC